MVVQKTQKPTNETNELEVLEAPSKKRKCSVKSTESMERKNRKETAEDKNLSLNLTLELPVKRNERQESELKQLELVFTMSDFALCLL